MELLDLEDYLLNESLRPVKGMKQKDFTKVATRIVEDLTSIFRIKEDAMAFIGSAGKHKDKDAISHNINIAISKKPILESNKVEDTEFFEFAKGQFKRLGLTCEQDGNKFVVKYPVSKSKNADTVDVRIQLTENLKWVKFSRYSPNLAKGESEYSGKYREALLSALSECAKKSIVSYFDTNENVKEYETYYLDMDEGLGVVTRTFEAKNGKLKKSVLLENSRKIISSDPKEIVGILFGEGVSTSEVMTYEDCVNKINGKCFPHKKKKEQILKKAKQNMIGMKLIVPEGIM